MTTPFSSERMAELEASLHRRRLALLAEIADDTGQTARDQEFLLADQVRDSGDESFLDHTLVVDAAATGRDVGELRAVEASLSDFHAGTYGYCIACGREIAYERLVAQPTAKRCITCQTRFEKTHSTTATPTL